MPHFADAALRLAIDDDAEPTAGLAQHLAECSDCRTRRDEIAANAAFARRVFADNPLAADGALAVGVPRSVTDVRAFRAARPRRLPPWLLGAGGLAAAAVLVFALVLTPLGGLAAQLLTIFEPKEFVPIRITAADAEQIRLLPRLDAFGTMRQTAPAKPHATSLADAARLAGFTPRRVPPSALLGGAHPRIVYLAGHTSAFTFSAAKASAYERRFKQSLPPMAPGVDGSTLRVTAAAAIVRRWDNGVVLLETKAPRVSSTGAPLGALRDYLLALPNVPPDVIAQLRAVGDPNTLPIPIPVDRTSAAAIDVNGAHGLALGDDSGLGAGVIWQRDGMCYAVYGPLPTAEVIALARSVG